MASVKVTVNLKVAELALAGPDSTIKSKIGEAVVTEMKRMIASGQSPVEGQGRFAEYKGIAQVRAAVVKAQKNRANVAAKAASQRISVSKARADAQKRVYPYSAMKKFPDKQVRPVNLELSGDMLTALTWQESEGSGLIIGILDGDDRINTIAQAHNEGPTNGRFPRRTFIPRRGETFVQTILRQIKDVYSEWLSDIINRSSK